MIETHNLRKTFKSRRGPVEAVAGVDLDVKKGEIFGFLGPNGAGKTTTLRMLSTLLPPTSGEATVAGFDLRRDAGQGALRHRLCQPGRQQRPRDPRAHRAGHPGTSLRDEQGSARCSAPRSSSRRSSSPTAPTAPTKTYSGGQKRRLDIGVGLMHLPQLLFLDEPTTGLDPQSRARMWDEVRRLRDTGTTVFLTTHYLEEADALCDRIAIIDHGKIVALGTPDELKRQVAGDVVVVGTEHAERPCARVAQGTAVRP